MKVQGGDVPDPGEHTVSAEDLAYRQKIADILAGDEDLKAKEKAYLASLVDDRKEPEKPRTLHPVLDQEEIEAALARGAAEGKARALAMFGTIDKHGNRNLPPQAERDTRGATSIRQAMKRTSTKPAGRKRTRSLEETYGSLIKQGLVRIVRKKGRPPEVIFITPKVGSI